MKKTNKQTMQIHADTYAFAYASIYLCVCVYLSIYLSIHLSIWLSYLSSCLTYLSENPWTPIYLRTYAHMYLEMQTYIPSPAAS